MYNREGFGSNGHPRVLLRILVNGIWVLRVLGVQGIKVYEGDLVLDPASKLLHEVPQHQPAICSTVCSVVRAVLV